MAEGIRIDQLPATVLPSADHEFPAMMEGMTVKLSLAQVAQVMLAIGLVDSDDLGALALKDAIDVSDIDATGTPSAASFLRGDGSWSGIDFVGFKANKNGVDQSGVSTSTVTKVTFTNVVFDIGDFYDSGNSRWTPPAGKHLLVAAVSISSGAVAGARMFVQIFKNGSAIASSSIELSSSFGDIHQQVTAIDDASGTDYYEVYVYIEGAGGKSLSGNITTTFFSGVML